ncbi:hypothetical protein C9374_000482 [Naegleria lovaniensis]|uniref:Uncharacterized protein n=1 Tax=Naegleria lovaniensis TaxID=51637 RepID=A0AA88GZ60_NAELO|nr:uncharacterized protein C9374_000482 [Naegleria lovaniensis]KAG2388318.1 hypothetical protein C9374_000482 [Naegleria lovaniensis]
MLKQLFVQKITSSPNAMGNSFGSPPSTTQLQPKNYWTTPRWWFRRMTEKVLDKRRTEAHSVSELRVSDQEMDMMMKKLRSKTYLTPSMGGKYLGLAMISLFVVCAVFTTLDFRRYEEYIAALKLENSAKASGKLERLTADTHQNSQHQRPRSPQDFRR